MAAKMCCRKLGLIVFKNLFLRKNQWVVTLMEFIFPILGLLLAFGMIHMVYGGQPRRGSYIGYGPPHTPYPFNEDELRWESKLCESDSMNSNPTSANFITYSPFTSETTQIMKQVAEDLCNYQGRKTYIGYLGVDEDKLETDWKNNDKFMGAVVFEENDVFSYKIRMKPELFPNTKKLFPGVSDTGSGPSNADCDVVRVGPNEEREKQYVKVGFIGLQLAVDKALTRKATGGQEFKHSISLQPFPYPPEWDTKDEFPLITALLGTYFSHAWGLCFMLPSITRNIVGEKETGISELLRLTGVSNTIQWLGWIIHVLMPQILIISILIILLVSPVVREAILENSDGFLVWIFMLLYVTASAAFGFFICSLCQKPTIATTVVELLWVMSLMGGVAIAFGLLETPYSVKVILMAIFPNFAIAKFYENVYTLETTVLDESDKGYGVRWSSLPVTAKSRRYSNDSVGISNLSIMIIFLGNIVVYMALSLYLEGVLPSEHGVKRPWYFFNCKRSQRQIQTPVPVTALPQQETLVESGSSDDMVAPSGSEVSEEHTEQKTEEKPEEETGEINLVQEPQPIVTGFEPEPLDAQVGIDIQGLRKSFGRKVAVNGVSLRMYSGDIFALLGHNGAGKTTLISMLTGFFAPTAGTAFVDGYDIRRDLGKARERMGLCPQHNMLFEWLSVSQQLCLFGMLRGLTYQQAKFEANILMGKMKFFDKSSTLAKKLSGGQKRKLSLGMALIGGTKVVILDEPTSGMDPQARREIWDILLDLRGQRTILLTTHFMEEADVLGDRIGIMASGMLQCCGSTAFLKKYYGTGYTLKLTINDVSVVANDQTPAEEPTTPEESTHIVPVPAVKPSPAAEAILVAVEENIFNASFKADARLDHASNEVFLSLPSETATTAALSQMFSVLTINKEKLVINTIGLSQTTMDEVFVRVGELADEEMHGAPVGHSEPEEFQRAPKQLKNKFFGQFTALLMKKFIYFFV